ncbi:hypothetical protein [Kribbella solani]|uniref:DUF222 domain-containing protein n=1 Tax=Kribbella solani TaxID=236067 RepID=A0A841DKF6_9ACTN|nr:hypothetical protein [Kribbella solani]MBB5977266.1 hypothetical protein [Kribbella solani]
MNRPAKHAAKPLADLMEQWRKRAELAIGRDALASIEGTLQQAGGRHLGAADLSPETIEAYGAATVLTLQSKHATWTRWNLLAEAARQTRLLRLSSATERTTVLERIIHSAEQYSINLTAPELIPTPLTRSIQEEAGKACLTQCPDGSRSGWSADSVTIACQGRRWTKPCPTARPSASGHVARMPSVRLRRRAASTGN